ncbi:DivIVA domain-containing protein [Terracoccus luteus]|uniref:DivIVA domain-containing protein n=1 Tax=Terracoccus luteus TaxID=53356 RepID=A0A839PZE1_9MICO|nr:DivIVA domain-containing protein [Terracoccus luteus]MBB2988074.1 DivIVA domain-containing protein [Terracoccus luteus]MCP2173725.1 DivIVA domain-containing protein [Terracoccus luteus]
MTRADLVTEITNVLFAQTSTLSRGYDVRAVDDLLDRLRERVLAGASAEEIEGLVTQARFTVRRRGYAVDEVDAFLARLPSDVRALGADADADADHRDGEPLRGATTGTRPDGIRSDPLPSAVSEPAPGLLDRLLRGLRGS